MWTTIIGLIQDHQHFILTTHVNPDGDAVGSELALARHLRSQGKEVVILNSNPTPPGLRFLDPDHELKHFSEKRHQRQLARADVVVVLDASDGWDRLGRIGPRLAQTSAVKVAIDHHPDAVDFVDVAVLDDSAAATGELVFELITAMAGSITKPIAEALYVAIVTDTGSFRFPKTSARTHNIAARLIAAGANPGQLYRLLYEQSPLGLVRLRGHVMNSLQTTASGQLAYAAIEQATLKTYGVRQADLDGFAGLGQQIENVRCSLLFVEMQKKQVKISFRSNGSVAVNGLAARFGGGGHPSAAGAIVKGSLATVMTSLLAEVTALLESGEPVA